MAGQPRLPTTGLAELVSVDGLATDTLADDRVAVVVHLVVTSTGLTTRNHGLATLAEPTPAVLVHLTTFHKGC